MTMFILRSHAFWPEDEKSRHPDLNRDLTVPHTAAQPIELCLLGP